MKLNTRNAVLCLAFCLLPAGAEPVLLARFDLAGLPLDAPPPLWSLLTLEAEELAPGRTGWRVRHQDTLLGYVPARITPYLRKILESGTPTRVLLAAHHHPARPGRHLQIEVWTQLREQEEFPAWTWISADTEEAVQEADLWD